MAVRINVTAVRDCPPAEVRAVMSDIIKPACANQDDCQPVGDLLQIHEHNGWTWFNTSVWGVGAGDLNRGLCRLARPALQFTTSDGDRWYLTVHGGPTGQVHFLHEFGPHSGDPDSAEDAEREAGDEDEDDYEPDPELAFLEDDPLPGSDGVKTAFDRFADELAEMGAHIPEGFRLSVLGLPYSAAVAAYRRWHAEEVSAALTAAGIAHDVAAVRAVLLWEGVTTNENSSDLGNLPRLLHVLGLGGEWDEYIRQAESPEPEQEPEACDMEPAEPEPPKDFVGPVVAITDGLPLARLDGGPVALPLKEIGLLRFVIDALAGDESAGVVLTVTLPPWAEHTALTVPGDEEIDDNVRTVEVTPRGFRIGLEEHTYLERRVLREQLGKRLARFFFRLPDGATIDVAFAKEGHPALTQRYRGPVRDGQWRVGQSYPPLTRDALAGALDLARAGEQRKYRLRDEAEAVAVVEAAKRDPGLYGMTVERKGRNVRCRDDVVGQLPKVIFRVRYAGQWDVASFDAAAARQIAEVEAQQSAMRRAGVEAARKRAAPHDEEMLLKGQQSVYWRSDFARLTDLEQETRERIDREMADLGFAHLGDLVAKKQRDIVMRLYASADGTSYGILMGKRTMYLGFEFFSRFADGTTLTTTTNGAVESHPSVGIYYKTCPGVAVAALYDTHCWGIARFRTHRDTEPVPLEATLLGVAQELDAAFVRRAGVEE